MNKTEAEWRAEEEKKGNRILRNGWPDFLVVEPDGTLRFVEIKSPTDRLSDDQEAMLGALRRAGLNVKVVRVGVSSHAGAGEGSPKPFTNRPKRKYRGGEIVISPSRATRESRLEEWPRPYSRRNTG